MMVWGRFRFLFRNSLISEEIVGTNPKRPLFLWRAYVVCIIYTSIKTSQDTKNEEKFFLVQRSPCVCECVMYLVMSYLLDAKPTPLCIYWGGGGGSAGVTQEDGVSSHASPTETKTNKNEVLCVR